VSEREARLKPEYAAEYPGMEPGRWLPAGELAKRLVERTHDRRKSGLYTRTFDPTHFEFRGGEISTRPRLARTRDTDPRISGGTQTGKKGDSKAMPSCKHRTTET
jgi:hypothetical protein